MTKDGFIERFGEIPRKDDITILAPKREDPTEQARANGLLVGGQCWVKSYLKQCQPVLSNAGRRARLP